MAVTIKDVAKETNLAISTISKYLNGGKVREKNRKKIEKAINKLGFIPNDAARGLRAFRTYTIGLLIGGGTNQHTATLISETEKQLRNKGYSLTSISLGQVGEEYDGYRMKQYVDYLTNRGVDGLIIAPLKNDIDYLESARLKNIPVVLIEESRVPEDENINSVLVDCAGGAYEIVEHLVKMGHSKIGILKGPSYKLTATERYTGYKRVMEDYGIPLREEYIIAGDYTYKAGYEGIIKLCSLKERPTAVFTTNYDTCLGALEAIRKLGLKIPDDISLVTFDDYDLSVVIRPHLTAVRQPLAQVAEVASWILYRRMNGENAFCPTIIRLKPKCFYRDSVKDLYEINNKCEV